MKYSDTHLYREIHQQPDILDHLLQAQKAATGALAKAIQERDITQVVIAARGTSDNAGRYAKYVLGAMNGISVALATPSLYSIYKRPPRLGNSLVLGISQSGRSPDIVSVLAEARSQGALTGAITNSPVSALAKQADYVIDLNAGEEQAVAATKTYTSELAAIALLSALLAADEEMLHALELVPAMMSSVLSMSEQIAVLAPRYRYMSHSVVIGRGYNYASAFELALKLKELTYTIVEPYSSADFLHGPLAMIEKGFPVIIFAPSGETLEEMRSMIHTLIAHGAEVICISDDRITLGLTEFSLAVPSSVPEWLSPITMIVPGQLFALHLAHTRGFDIDTPRSIQKVSETY